MAQVDLEQERSRSEVADYLREFADEQDAGSDGSDRTDRAAGRPGRPGRPGRRRRFD